SAQRDEAHRRFGRGVDRERVRAVCGGHGGACILSPRAAGTKNRMVGADPRAERPTRDEVPEDGKLCPYCSTRRLAAQSRRASSFSVRSFSSRKLEQEMHRPPAEPMVCSKATTLTEEGALRCSTG